MNYHRLAEIATFFSCAFLLLAGCAPTSTVTVHEAPKNLAALVSATPYPAFKKGMDSLFADSLFPPSNVGVKIVSLSTNEMLYELNPDMLFNPASNQKLFTSATALTTLGEGFPLSTVVTMDSVEGIIGIKGFGDPLVSTANLDSLAVSVAARLPQRPSWKLIGDVSYFDDLYWGAGWTWDEEPAAYGMFITPLILNNNTIDVNVWTNSKPGEPPLVTTSPATNYVSVENNATTVADSVRNPIELSRKWRERSNIITVRGEVLANGKGASTSLSVWQPERYAITVFSEQLKFLGVPVTGLSIDTLTGREVEIVRRSHRLDSAVTFMNKVSDNLTAEVLLKCLAAERLGVPGSAEKGINVVHEFLAARNIDTTRINIADGSGLSRYNLTSAATVIKLLQAMYADKNHFDAFYHSLPVAGVDGTISRRMTGTAAQGNLRAKTGTLSAVSALSGYVRMADGEMLAVSILMQNFPGSSRYYRQTQDRIGEFLSNLRRDRF